MPAAIPLIAAVITTTAGLYEANQQTQHAKGAAQAQQDAMTKQAADAATADKNTMAKKADVGSATQQAAIQALRASMSASSGAGGTILTGPQGQTGMAPTTTKTLLGI